MRKDLLNVYRKVRHAGVTCIVGENAAISMRIARTILQWEALERAGLVSLQVRADDDPSAARCECGHPHCKHNETLERDGAWGVVGMYRTSADDRWETSDSIWGCVGYQNVSSPYENCYVPDIMRNTIDELSKALKGRFCEHCGKRVA